MKLRKTDPWKPASDYSRELSGLTVNLLVNDISKATEFIANVIEANIIYCWNRFAIFHLNGGP